MLRFGNGTDNFVFICGLQNPVPIVGKEENLKKKNSPGEDSTGSVEFKYCMFQSASKRTKVL